MTRAASVLDYRTLAKARLPHFPFEYIDGGSYGEVTLRRNVIDLAAGAVRQRVLHDVSALDLSTTWFGQEMTMPVALAPSGLAGLTARHGEVQAAQAAGVSQMLSLVEAKMQVAMALTGCRAIIDIGKSTLVTDFANN